MTPPTAIQQYGSVSREYAERAQAYGPLATAAAEAEALCKREKAKFKLRLRDSGEVRTDAEAETRAEADDRIGDLLQRRLMTAAERDAALERLKQLRAQLDFGRSVVSNEREADRIHSTGGAA